MKILKSIFRKNEKSITTYQEFWNWFETNEKAFFNVVKQERNIENGFFAKISTKLNELREGYFYLAGMYDDHTVELILTADGEVKNIVFVEELVDAAPQISGWKFTALKPALDIKDVNIEMANLKFNSENMSFYANEDPDHPDEIDITIVHDDLNEENREVVINGVCIYLDNYLGELNFVTTIDNISFEGRQETKNELIPISKLKDFLNWRQKEFVGRYEGVRHNTENDNYAGLEARLQNGNPLIAIVNRDLLQWDSKASHPWMLNISIFFGGNDSGMPDDVTYNLLNEIEEQIVGGLKDFEGYLNIGRQTAEGRREVYLACKDFRKPSGVLHQIQKEYAGKVNINYEIFKDKYWRSMDRFLNN